MKRIQLDDVLAWLAVTGPYRVVRPPGHDRWHLLRTVDGEDPVCALANAVAGGRRWKTDYGSAATFLGRPEELADRLAGASDALHHPDRAALEAALELIVHDHDP